MSFFDPSTLQSLKSSWDARVQEMRADKLQSYADVTLEHLMSRMSTEDIESQLRAKMATVNHKSHLAVPILSYNTRFFKQSLVQRNEVYDRLSDDEKRSFTHAERMRNRWIESRGWNWTVATVMDDELGQYETRGPVSLHTLFRNTKLLDQIAYQFGDHFSVTSHYEDGVVHADEFIVVRKVNLSLNFYPNGPSPWLQTKHDAMEDWYATRAPTVLTMREFLEVTDGSSDFNPEHDTCLECFESGTHPKWCTYHGMPGLEFAPASYQTPPRINTRAPCREGYEPPPPAPRNLKKRKLCYCLNPEDSDCE